MILDRLDNFSMYFDGLDPIKEFILSLDTDAPEGRHDLDGDNVFAILSRYETRPRKECRPEAHKEYVDIQILLEGQEVIEWFPLEGLDESIPYDSEKDVAFYKRPDTEGTIVTLSKGIFAVFFPHDAHMPQVSLKDKPEAVVKLVVKIRTGLL